MQVAENTHESFLSTAHFLAGKIVRQTEASCCIRSLDVETRQLLQTLSNILGLKYGLFQIRNNGWLHFKVFKKFQQIAHQA